MQTWESRGGGGGEEECVMMCFMIFCYFTDFNPNAVNNVNLSIFSFRSGPVFHEMEYWLECHQERISLWQKELNFPLFIMTYKSKI